MRLMGGTRLGLDYLQALRRGESWSVVSPSSLTLHNINYRHLMCSGYLVMSGLGQLEMSGSGLPEAHAVDAQSGGACHERAWTGDDQHERVTTRQDHRIGR